MQYQGCAIVKSRSYSRHKWELPWQQEAFFLVILRFRKDAIGKL